MAPHSAPRCSLGLEKKLLHAGGRDIIDADHRELPQHLVPEVVPARVSLSLMLITYQKVCILDGVLASLPGG